MAKTLISTVDGVHCNAWNHCGERMAGGSLDGCIHIFDSPSQFACTFKWKAHNSSIVKLVWGPPEYGDVIACCCMDGTISLWEEAGEDIESCKWKLCNRFQDSSVPVLDIQFGNCVSGLKLAEFQNVSHAVERFEKCSSLTASIAWKSSTNSTQQPTFILGFNSNLPYFNVAKIWEFMEVHQHWHPTAEFIVPGEDADQVYAISWAPNIGRPYELIAIAGSKGVSIWHVELDPNTNERPKLTRVATFTGHVGEVWQLDWDMGGMTLATSGNDGTVRLWQSNTNGVWQEVAVIESSQ
ncbi:protein SEH1 isoform X2 [Cryptomeria japonica]|uniref:protein SEH1 isoform X2 n=1 Tax=Cryptomeria japonica TaxID=3369 RepID=UPI0027DA1D36|nr:protein SEH1 isoform X2 [Cryptomeria japonica]